jgi:EAL domain-containing protein (putative c-di-GMP-specific phosphodiesterase class I)
MVPMRSRFPNGSRIPKSMPSSFSEISSVKSNARGAQTVDRYARSMRKVDRSFVEGLDGDAGEDSMAIVRAVVSLAAALGMRTVAEGIETAKQLEVVTSLGCDLGQGFLLGRPSPTVPSPHAPAP